MKSPRPLFPTCHEDYHHGPYFSATLLLVYTLNTSFRFCSISLSMALMVFLLNWLVSFSGVFDLSASCLTKVFSMRLRPWTFLIGSVYKSAFMPSNLILYRTPIQFFYLFDGDPCSVTTLINGSRFSFSTRVFPNGRASFNGQAFWFQLNHASDLKSSNMEAGSDISSMKFSELPDSTIWLFNKPEQLGGTYLSMS